MLLLSRDDLEVLEACVLICLDNNLLDGDTEKDAKDVLNEIRQFLGKDAKGVAYALGEEVRTEYEAGDGGHGR